MKLRITERDYEKMRKATALSFTQTIPYPPETGCILLTGINEHKENPALLVKKVILPTDDGDISVQSSDGFVFSSTFLRKVLLEVRKQNLAGFLTVHTHPFSNKTVNFSGYDDMCDPDLMQNLYELQPNGLFGSLVLGKEAVKGRIWNAENLEPKTLKEMVIIGEELKHIQLNGKHEEIPAKASEIFDSALALTGKGATNKLANMRIGVIGASGTGSLVCELLLRAGVGEIVLFEFDYIEKRNLNRIFYSRKKDVKRKRKKADRIAEALLETELPTRITIIPNGDIRNEEVALELRGCDFIFGCVDNSNWARLIMTEVCYQYLIPYIDLGTEIGISKENEIIQSVDSRVSYLTPERPCLVCTGIISLNQLRLEGFCDEEKQRVVEMGYTTDINITAPATMDLNMRAASYGVMILRHLLQPFLNAVPTHIKESITNFNVRSVKGSSSENCQICNKNKGIKALGDSRKLTIE